MSASDLRKLRAAVYARAYWLQLAIAGAERTFTTAEELIADLRKTADAHELRLLEQRETAATMRLELHDALEQLASLNNEVEQNGGPALEADELTNAGDFRGAFIPAASEDALSRDTYEAAVRRLWKRAAEVKASGVVAA